MTRFGVWRGGYAPEPGEMEIGRVEVSSDGGSGGIEASWLVVTDRRLILLTLRFPPWFLVAPLLIVALMAWSPLGFPVIAFAAVLAWRRLRVEPRATQFREDLIGCRPEPAPSVVLKPKLLLVFRDGTRWGLRNPAKGAGRLDRIVALMQKGGLTTQM